MNYKQFYILLLQYLHYRQSEAEFDFKSKMNNIIYSLNHRPENNLSSYDLQDLLVAKVILDTKRKIFNEINELIKFIDDN